MNGHMLLKSVLTDGALNTVNLPAGLHGVIMVRVTDGAMVTTNKIAVP